MAQLSTTTIDQLPPAATLTGAEQVWIEQGGGDYRVSTLNISALATSSGGGGGSIVIPTTIVMSSETISAGGFIWVNNTTNLPITLTLSPGLMPFLVIKDTAGNANVNLIRITSAAGIDGQNTSQLFVAYQWLWLGWNGSSYSIIG